MLGYFFFLSYCICFFFFFTLNCYCYSMQKSINHTMILMNFSVNIFFISIDTSSFMSNLILLHGILIKQNKWSLVTIHRHVVICYIFYYYLNTVNSIIMIYLLKQYCICKYL